MNTTTSKGHIMRRKNASRTAQALALASGFALLLAGCASSGGSGGGDDDVFTIGVLAPKTGSLAPYGVAMEQGFEVAVDLINADGGIGGKQVEYILEDDQTDPKAASTQASKLLNQDEVDVLIGTTSSATTLAVIPQVERAEVPFIYIAEGEAKTCDASGEEARRFIFGNGATPEQKMDRFVPYMLENLGQSVYFIGSDYVFPHFVNDITADLVEENGGTVVAKDYAPLGTTDFSSYISKIQSADPDVLFISVVGADGVALVKQLTEFGIGDMKLTGIPSFAGEVLSGVSDIAQGVYTVDNYWEGLDNPENQRFVEAFSAAYPDVRPVHPMAAVGTYSTLLMLKEAVEKAGSTDGGAIADALPGISVDSPAGTLTMGANHIVTAPMLLLQIEGDGYALVENFGEVEHPGFSGCSSQDA